MSEACTRDAGWLQPLSLVFNAWNHKFAPFTARCDSISYDELRAKFLSQNIKWLDSLESQVWPYKHLVNIFFPLCLKGSSYRLLYLARRLGEKVCHLIRLEQVCIHWRFLPSHRSTGLRCLRQKRRQIIWKKGLGISFHAMLRTQYTTRRQLVQGNPGLVATTALPMPGNFPKKFYPSFQTLIQSLPDIPTAPSTPERPHQWINPNNALSQQPAYLDLAKLWESFWRWLLPQRVYESYIDCF